MDLNVLKKALLWSMKENLTVQILYPDYKLPADYKAVISDIDHADIAASTCEDKILLKGADVVIFNTWEDVCPFPLSPEQVYVIRTSFADLVANETSLYAFLPIVTRINVVITDIPDFNPDMEKRYFQFLINLNERICREYQNNHGVQVNILTDRMMLDSMNNCGAGNETITLAPDGRFYVCPGFYLDGSNAVGDIDSGLDIKNAQLYQLSHAPICRICDAWHCKRCVWQNKRATREVNTPGREQCVVSHIERNASRSLLSKIREIGTFLPDKEIKELDYLDPFEQIIRNEK